MHADTDNIYCPSYIMSWLPVSLKAVVSPTETLHLCFTVCQLLCMWLCMYLGHCSAYTKTLLLIWLPAVWTWPTTRPCIRQKCLVCNPAGKPQLYPPTHTNTGSSETTHSSEKEQTEGWASSPQRKNGSNSTADRKTQRSGLESKNWCQFCQTIPTPTMAAILTG